MAQVGNSENRFGGEFMIQDSDHMSGIVPSKDKAKSNAPQTQQSQAGVRQQGDDRSAGKQRRQAH